MKPMLAQLMPEHTEAKIYLNNPAWVVEQKLDGERLIIEVNNREANGFNRKGEYTKVPDNIAANFDRKAFDGTWMFDGELLGGKYFIFDCIAAADPKTTFTIYPELKHQARFDFLKTMMDRWTPTNIELIPHAEGTLKQPFYDACFNNHAEGVVFKLNLGHYRPGKRTIEMLKCKFTTTAEVVVTELHRDGSELGVSTGIYHGTQMVDAGGCKIPKEALEFLKEDDVIEVRYLYASPDHKLVQPIWLRPRFDKSPVECDTSQLKYTNRKPIQ